MRHSWIPWTVGYPQIGIHDQERSLAALPAPKNEPAAPETQARSKRVRRPAWLDQSGIGFPAFLEKPTYEPGSWESTSLAFFIFGGEKKNRFDLGGCGIGRD